MQGHVDSVARDRIAGWAWDPADPDGTVALRIYDNGVVIGEVLADRFREDLRDIGMGDGRHAFSWSVPGGLSPAIEHAIDVRRRSDGWKLVRSTDILEVDPAAALAASKPLDGHLDTCNRNVISGWAWDSADPDRPVTLQVLDNRVVVARVMANRYREDLQKSGYGDGRHAFEVRIPGGLSPLERHVIQIRHEGDGREIPNSPASIEASASFDDALEMAVKNAVSALAAEGDRDRILAFLTTQTEELLQARADVDGQRNARAAYRDFRRRGYPAGSSSQSAGDPGLRALVIDDDVPDPARDAGSQAILSHMRALQSLNYAVGFVAAHERPSDADLLPGLEAAGFVYYGAPYYVSVEEVLKRQRNCFDVVYLHRLSNASKYLALAREYNPRARVLYSVADLHHVRVARQAEIEERPELLAFSRRLRLAECTAAFQADAVLTHSLYEDRWLRQAVPDAKVYVAPWAVQPQPIMTKLAARSGVAFIGGYRHTPNVDAACWLVEEIMPLVWQHDPTIDCVLVGSGMPDIVKELAGPNVDVAGAVPDLTEVLERVRLTIAPLRYGAGVKGKVLDSFAAGTPCVMSKVAAEGLGLPPPLDQLVGADAAALAALILQLHRSSGLAGGVGKAGLSFIKAGFNEEVVAASLRAAIEGLVIKPKAAADTGKAA